MRSTAGPRPRRPADWARRIHALAWLAAPAVLATSAATHGQAASRFSLASPLDCRIGESCFIQQYVDHATGAEPTDYACGSETYRGHEGTDFRVPTLEAQRRGVTVLAAAAGVVRSLRDEVDDISVAKIGAAAVANRECGNGVLIDHGQGWQTQYCHMAKRSVRVRTGQVLTSGQPLGQVGESGQAEFPHLHLTVRKDGQVVDPFAYGAPAGSCRAGVSLWDAKARSEMAYRTPELLNAGFATSPVGMDAVEDGLPEPASLPPETAVLVAYARLINLQAGDLLKVTLKRPDASILATATEPMDHSKAQYLSFVGGRRPTGGWPPGAYTAEIAVNRKGATVFARSIQVSVRP